MRGQETGQFGCFDGLDNRRTVYELLDRLGKGLSEEDAGMARAGFLQGLIVRYSANGFAGKPVIVDPCSTDEAYHLFVAITGCMGVQVQEAAELLEQVVRLLPRGVDGDRRAALLMP